MLASFSFLFLPGFVWTHGSYNELNIGQRFSWTFDHMGWRLFGDKILDLWPPSVWSDEGSSGTRSWTFDHHQMKAPQGQDPGPLTTIRWRLLRDKILEYDHMGWRLLRNKMGWRLLRNKILEHDHMGWRLLRDKMRWRLLRDKMLAHDHHGIKASQGQDPGAWPPWDEGFSGTRCWSMTTMGASIDSCLLPWQHCHL